MLVISRRKEEAVLIGDARVKVLDVRGNTVRLGIMAPDSITVLREELLQAKGGSDGSDGDAAK